MRGVGRGSKVDASSSLLSSITASLHNTYKPSGSGWGHTHTQQHTPTESTHTHTHCTNLTLVIRVSVHTVPLSCKVKRERACGDKRVSTKRQRRLPAATNACARGEEHVRIKTLQLSGTVVEESLTNDVNTSQGSVPGGCRISVSALRYMHTVVTAKLNRCRECII